VTYKNRTKCAGLV